MRLNAIRGPASSAQYVFAYGSLAGATVPGATVRDLRGHRRRWGVAMDNAVAIAGYKRYLNPATGVAPDVAVAFLDVVRDDASGSVNGVCVPVGDAALEGLDRRERNYDRSDVTQFVADPPGRVWVYRGNVAGRARADAGRRDGRLVVVLAYLELVEAAFATLGADAAARFAESTDEPGCPVLDLVRTELPA